MNNVMDKFTKYDADTPEAVKEKTSVMDAFTHWLNEYVKDTEEALKTTRLTSEQIRRINIDRDLSAATYYELTHALHAIMLFSGLIPSRPILAHPGTSNADLGHEPNCDIWVVGPYPFHFQSGWTVSAWDEKYECAPGNPELKCPVCDGELQWMIYDSTDKEWVHLCGRRGRFAYCKACNLSGNQVLSWLS